MKEEGTEILFRPGSEDMLNLLEYCTIEETNGANEAKSNPEVPSTRSSPSPSTEEEQRQELNTERAFFPASNEEQPSHPEVNRHDSLVESGTTDEDDETVSSNQDDSNEKDGNKYHPALKAAVFTEGQEAVWHEDEYSTISSVYVTKPEKTTTEDLPTHSQNSRKKMKVPFFKSRGKKVQKEQPISSSEEVEPMPRPVKIHIKKKRVAKAVVLLPPKEAGVETTEENANENNSDNERLIEENERFGSITQNSIEARRLLDTILSGDGLDEEESELVAKEAFNHATAARRLAHHSKNNDMESHIADDDDCSEEAIELENVISYLAEEGEQAALQHRRQHGIDEDSDDQDEKDENDQEGAEYSNAIDLTMVEANESEKTKKKRRGKFPISGYASRAVHYLESILPKNAGNEKADDASNAEDFWSDAGISTLGLKNDTLEYGLNTDEDGDDPNNTLDQDVAGSPRKVDTMSLSSLNEILDGGGTINGKKSQLENKDVLNEGARRRSQATQEPSPRAAVQEIGIPRKNKSTGLPPTNPKERTRILGLMTPKSAKASNESKKEQQEDDVENSGNKKWSIFFNTPRASDEVPSQLNLVQEEPTKDLLEAQSPEEIKITSPKSAVNEEDDLEILVKADSDSCLDMPETNRYAPACVDEESEDKYRPIPQDNEIIELKVSVATTEDQNSENKSGDDDITSENNVTLQGDHESKASINDEESRYHLSALNDEKRDDQGSQDRYHAEPVGKTPRRDGIEMEKNTNRKVHEELSLPTLFEEHVAVTTKKEEQSNPQQINPSENKAVEKPTANEGLSCDPTEISIEDASKLNGAENSKEVVAKVNDKKEIAQVNLKPDNALPKKSNNPKKKVDNKVKKPRHEDMSTAGSEGSKSKIFGRVVDMMVVNNQHPLVPIAIVEEKYFVDKDMKKISTIYESSKPTKIKSRVPASKPPTGKRYKAIPKMKKAPMSTSFNMADDSTTVVQKAISNGNLKAVESNEEGDDVVPLNYLSVMLRKKLSEEQVEAINTDIATDIGEHNQQRSSGEKLDGDSYVAAIRGPRQKQAPGVALEEIAIRNYQNNRDPTIGNGVNTIRIDLAPTPRRPEGKQSTFDDDEEEEKNEFRDPQKKQEEDERQRRKVITERLFQAGSSSFRDVTMIKKETPEDFIKTAPTVASAESYCEDTVQDQSDPATESDENREIIEKNAHLDEPHSRTKFGRGRRILSIPFLKRK